MKRTRTVTEALLSIVLILEGAVLFFAALVAYGLKVLEPGLPAWAALPIGGALIVVYALATRVLRWPAGLAFGWVLQGVLIALGILLPMMYLIGAGFALLWIWCFVRGRRIDAARATARPTEGEPA